jgi:hypothetical protein
MKEFGVADDKRSIEKATGVQAGGQKGMGSQVVTIVNPQGAHLFERFYPAILVVHVCAAFLFVRYSFGEVGINLTSLPILFLYILTSVSI